MKRTGGSAWTVVRPTSTHSPTISGLANHALAAEVRGTEQGAVSPEIGKPERRPPPNPDFRPRAFQADVEHPRLERRYQRRDYVPLVAVGIEHEDFCVPPHG